MIAQGIIPKVIPLCQLIAGGCIGIMTEILLKELHPDNFYHLATEGLEQMTLLKDDEDYKAAMNYVALSAWRTGTGVVAFVIMSNHIHELVICKDRDQAVKTVQLFKQQLSKYLRNKYALSKVLHRTGYSISQIDSDQYLRNCIAYIFRNPVSAKICSKPEAYKWSSYPSVFSRYLSYSNSMSGGKSSGTKLSALGFTKSRNLLRTGFDLSKCPFTMDPDGLISLDSYVRSDIVEKVFWNSGKSLLYHMGCCNDSKMEYELVYRPLMNVSDSEMYDIATKLVANRFRGKTIAELGISDKCSILKYLLFNHRTSIPQLSRILGLPRELVKRVLFQ